MYIELWEFHDPGIRVTCRREFRAGQEGTSRDVLKILAIIAMTTIKAIGFCQI